MIEEEEDEGGEDDKIDNFKKKGSNQDSTDSD